MISARELRRDFEEMDRMQAEHDLQEAKDRAEMAERKLASIRCVYVTPQEEADQAIADLAADYPEEIQ